jgi:soluble lytic murein transglycosylase-like protein
VKRIKRRAIKVHFVGIVLTIILIAGFLGWNWVVRIERALIQEAYGIVRYQTTEMAAKIKLLEVLRNKPMSVGQALEVADVVLEEAPRREVPIPIILAIMSQESSFMVGALSHKGAKGLMQIMPAIFQTYSEDPAIKKNIFNSYNPAINVRAAIIYLGDLRRTHEDWSKALGTYYSGEPNNKVNRAYVRQVMTKADEFGLALGKNR